MENIDDQEVSHVEAFPGGARKLLPNIANRFKTIMELISDHQDTDKNVTVEKTTQGVKVDVIFQHFGGN